MPMRLMAIASVSAGSLPEMNILSAVTFSLLRDVLPVVNLPSNRRSFSRTAAYKVSAQSV